MVNKIVNQRHLSMLHWNINGFQKRQQELRQYLYREQTDVVCLNELRVSGEKLFVRNYSVYYKNRANDNHGGVAVLTNKILKYNRVDISASFEAVPVNLDNDLTIVAAYCPSSTRIVASEIDTIMNLNKHVIIIGDLNAKRMAWDNTTPNAFFLTSSI